MVSSFLSHGEKSIDVAGLLTTIKEIDAAMRKFISNGETEIPLPTQGNTFRRWEILATVAARSLSLAKIFESHTDAWAILQELDHATKREHLLAVWAAENPKSPLLFDSTTGKLSGQKDWCSGASIVDEGLLTAKTPDGRSVLVLVAMHESGVQVLPCRWFNHGMAAAETTSIVFQEVKAHSVGDEDAYLERPGFWHGGAGIAAVWFGGAVAVAQTLANSRRIQSDSHAAAHLGAVHSHLLAAHALLYQTACRFDQNPVADAMVPALSLRAVVENAATEVILRTGRALGAVPLCTRNEHAQRVADLEIFLRQSHAEGDLARLGQALRNTDREWLL